MNIAARDSSGRVGVAGWILSNSKVVPEWAKWAPEAGPSLAAYQQLVLDESDDITQRIASLRGALTADPRSGLILTRLAGEHDLAADRPQALFRYAQAAHVHPRYVVARYRVAIELSFLADGQASELKDRAADRREQLDDLLGPLKEAWGADATKRREALSRKAQQQRKHSVRLRHWYRPFWEALRRSERRYWLNGFASRREWQRRVLDSASLAVGIRGGDDGPRKKWDKVIRWANRRLAPWQIAYNLACAYALMAKRPEAIYWLERSRLQPRSEQLSRAWLERDPDLESLHSEKRFRLLAETLRKTERQEVTR